MASPGDILLFHSPFTRPTYEDGMDIETDPAFFKETKVTFTSFVVLDLRPHVTKSKSPLNVQLKDTEVFNSPDKTFPL